MTATTATTGASPQQPHASPALRLALGRGGAIADDALAVAIGPLFPHGREIDHGGESARAKTMEDV